MPVLLTIVSTSITRIPTNDAHFSDLIIIKLQTSLMSSLSENLYSCRKAKGFFLSVYNLSRFRFRLQVGLLCFE